VELLLLDSAPHNSDEPEIFNMAPRIRKDFQERLAFEIRHQRSSAACRSEVIRGRDVDSFSPALTGLPICVAASQLTPFAEIANDVKK